jgi:hypothetical protein
MHGADRGRRTPRMCRLVQLLQIFRIRTDKMPANRFFCGKVRCVLFERLDWVSHAATDERVAVRRVGAVIWK